MDGFRDFANDPKHRRRFERLLYLAAERGDSDLVAERLGWGVDPNSRFGKARTPLMANVRGYCPSAATVRALLNHGADPELTDEAGLTALDYARRKLMRLMRGEDSIPPLTPPFEGGGLKPRKSPSLDENDQLVLGPDEQADIDRMRAELGEDGGEFVRIYWQERLRAARRVFDDPAEVETIIEILEATGKH